MNFDMADTVDGWIELYRVHRRIAEMAIEDSVAYPQAWSHAGFCVECLLKAAIMRKEGLNRWPTRQERRDLYVHTIIDLLSILRYNLDPNEEVAAAWAVVTGWQRSHTYVPNMPHKVARDCLEAVFSGDGVAPWIFQNYLTPYSKQAGITISA